jgi:hypothetical protein
MAKKRSSAWKDFERTVALAARAAGFSRAYRVLRGDDIGISATDVILPELPFVRIDSKYRKDSFYHHALFKEAESKYCQRSEDFLILPTKGGNERGSLSTVRTEVLFKLLAQAFLTSQERPVGALGCPFCKGLAIPKNIGLGLAECTCTSCSASYFVKASDVPATAEDVALGASSPSVNSDFEEDHPLEICVSDEAYSTTFQQIPKRRGRKKNVEKTS